MSLRIPQAAQISIYANCTWIKPVNITFTGLTWDIYKKRTGAYFTQVTRTGQKNDQKTINFSHTACSQQYWFWRNFSVHGSESITYIRLQRVPKPLRKEWESVVELRVLPCQPCIQYANRFTILQHIGSARSNTSSTNTYPSSNLPVWVGFRCHCV